MVEEQRVGGTCLHRGCIPAKELLQTAEVLRTIRSSSEFGVTAGEPSIDLPTSHARKHQVIDRLTSGLETLLKGRKVTVVNGRGTLTRDGRGVAVNGDEVRGRNTLIATGSAPRSLPGIDFDGERVLSSDHVLEIPEAPERVAVIGGGAIGCEFASFLVDVGSQVTLLEALPQILPGADQQVAQTVARAFAKRGISLSTGVKITGLDRGRDPLELQFEGKN